MKRSLLYSILSIALPLAFTILALVAAGSGDWHNGAAMYEYCMPILMVAFAGLLVLAIVSIVQELKEGRPLESLKQTYAAVILTALQVTLVAICCV